MPDRTQDLTNHRKVATACKNYTDTQIAQAKEEIYWHIGEYSVTTSDDNTSASVKTVPSGATRCKIKRVYGNCVKLAPSTASDNTVAKDKVIPENTFKLTIDKVGGMSYKYNQLLPNNQTDYSNYGITITNNHDGTYTINGTATTNIVYNLNTAITGKTNHYFYYNFIDTAITGLTLEDLSTGSWYTTSKSVKQYTGTTMQFIIRISAGTALTNVVVMPMAFDLTDMGITATDVATATTELLKRGIDVNQYNEYSTGTIRDAMVSEITTDGGINKFNKNTVTLNKKMDNLNVITDDSNYFVSDYIRVNSSETYCYNLGISFYTCFYDEYKNYISGGTYDVSFTTPATAKYMRVSATKARLDTLMISKGSTPPSTYVTYNSIIKQIPAEVQALSDYGVGVNENIYNYIDLILKKYFYNAVKYNLKNINKSSFSVQTSGITSGYNYRFNVTGFKVNDMYSSTSIIYNNTKTLNCGESSYDATNEIGFSFHLTEHYLILYTKTLATINALYDYLQANDTIIIFKQQTPIETDISTYLADFNPVELNNNYASIEFVNQYNADMPNKVSFYGTIKETLCTAIEQRRNGTLIKTITLSSNTADYGYSDNVSANVRDYTTNTGTLNVGKRAYESGDEEDSDIKTDELNVSYYPLTTPTSSSITAIENVIVVQAGDELAFYDSDGNLVTVPSDLTYRIEVAN